MSCRIPNEDLPESSRNSVFARAVFRTRLRKTREPFVEPHANHLSSTDQLIPSFSKDFSRFEDVLEAKLATEIRRQNKPGKFRTNSLHSQDIHVSMPSELTENVLASSSLKRAHPSTITPQKRVDQGNINRNPPFDSVGSNIGDAPLLLEHDPLRFATLPQYIDDTSRKIVQTEFSKSSHSSRTFFPVNDTKFSENSRDLEDHFFEGVQYQLVQDNWWVETSVMPSAKSAFVVVGNNEAYGSFGVGRRDGISEFTFGWRDFIVQEFTNAINKEVAFGIAKGRYGAFLDISRESHAIALEGLAKFVEASGFVDLSQRQYGARVRIRNLDVAIRHQFKHELVRASSTFATQIFAGYGPIALTGGIDILNAQYSIGVGLHGTSITMFHDFDDRISKFLFNFGRAWEISLDANFMDSNSDELYARVGFGRLAHKLFSIGAGLTHEGLPQIFTALQLPESLIEMQLAGSDPGYVFQYAITVGKETQLYRFKLKPNKLRIPLLKFLSNSTQIIDAF